jgi:hypothetical protein
MSKTKSDYIRELICVAMENIRTDASECCVCDLLEVHKLAYGHLHFTEVGAKMAVAAMENVDGSHGEHWSKAVTDKAADEHGIKCKDDFYYLCNMYWSDFAQVLGNDAAHYIKMAKAKLTDPDAGDGQILKEYLARFM